MPPRSTSPPRNPGGQGLQWPRERAEGTTPAQHPSGIPNSVDYLEPQALSDRARGCREAFDAALAGMDLQGLDSALEDFYLPAAGWLLAEREARKTPLLMVGVCGAQGSGKSTTSELLRICLEQGFGARTVVMSIDDLYYTRAEREKLGVQVHPLLVTRGVPGTHDVALGMRVLDELAGLRAKPESTVAIPKFDKATDNRAPVDEWQRVTGPVDVVIFEGWCVGAQPQPGAELQEPVNRLERDEDTDGAWRDYVNAQLASTYSALFARIDLLVFLKVDSMARVFQWRKLQERKLERRVKRSGDGDTRVMSREQVERFIMHYERITRHLLAEMPNRARLVVELGPTHATARIRFNEPDPRR